MPFCLLGSRSSWMPMGTPQLSNALLFLDAFGNGDFPSLSSGSEYAISSSAFLSSNVPDGELQASVFRSFDVGTGGWGDCRCCVQRHAVEVRGLSRIVKTRHHELHFLLPNWRVFLTRVHIVKLSRNSCVMRVASVAPLPCGTLPSRKV